MLSRGEGDVSKIVRGVKSRGKHFGGRKWGLADIRKWHDGLGKKITVLHSKRGSLNHNSHSVFARGDAGELAVV